MDDRAASFITWTWLPSLALLAIAAYEIARSLTAHNYPQYAFTVHHELLNGLSVTCYILAGVLFLFPPFRRLLAGHLDKLSKAPWKSHALWVGLAFLGACIWLGFIRYCQYRAYLLPQDTAYSVNYAHDFIRHRGLQYTMWGAHPLAIHFMLLMPVFSPALLIWDSPVSLLLAHNIVIVSAPFAVYALIYLMTASSLAGFIGLLLSLSTPYFYEVFTANLHIGPAAAFFPLAMLCIALRRWLLSLVFFLLMVSSYEIMCLIIVGLGIYAIYGLDWRKFRSWVLGLGICLTGIAVFAGELTVLYHYGKKEVVEVGTLERHKIYQHLVPPDTPQENVLKEVASHPLRTLRIGFSSRYRFYPTLRVLFFAGFLCLLAPMAMVPFLIIALPQILSGPGHPIKFLGHYPITLYDFGMHHATYMFGPLLWATAHGTQRAYDWLRFRGWQSWLLIWAFLISGTGFRYAHRTLHPNWHPEWFDAMPRVMSQIPPRARVWVENYASPPLSNRRWIRWIEMAGGNDMLMAGWQRLFKPDYVLFGKAFVVYAKPPFRDQVLTFLGRHRYVKIADEAHIVLLKAPDPSPAPEEIPDWIQLPAPDPKTVAIYGKYILEAPIQGVPPTY